MLKRDLTKPGFHGIVPFVAMRLDNPVVKTLTGHWRGAPRLWPVILLNVIGVGLALNLVQRNAEGAGDGLVLSLAVVSCLIVPIWQGVGLFRTCSTHVQETGDNMLPWAGYMILAAVLLATLSQTIGSVLMLERFQAPPEVAKAALVLPVSDDGREVRIEGEIDYAVLEAFNAALERNPGLQQVTLASDGGLIYAARAISGVVLEHGLNTHVVDTCASACTLIFAAGQQRTMGPSARLGFHSYGKRTPNHILMVDAGTEQAKDTQFLRERGVTDAFLQGIHRAGKDEMWFPDRATLNASGFLTPVE